MYVCLKTLCLSWNMKPTHSTINSQVLDKLWKLKDNDTRIKESSCEIIETQRKRYPNRGIVVCLNV